MATKPKGFYRDKHGHVILQVYDPQKRGMTKIPRGEYAFLDSASDEEVADWRKQYLETNRLQVRRTLEKLLLPTDEAQYLFDRFLEEYQKLRRTTDSTVSDEKGRWHGYIVPFFVKEHQAKDVRTWSLQTAAFPPWLMGSELEINQQKKVIGLLERFGQYLARHHKVSAPWGFIKPTENVSLETPLEYEVAPEEILAWARTREPRAALLALFGYFASLRPEETMALKMSDILTSDEARTRAKTYPRFKTFEHAKLGSGVSINVRSAIKKGGKVGDPKNPVSKAVVNIFNADAAILIGKIIKDLPEGWLFPKKLRHKGSKVTFLHNAPRPCGRDTMFKFWKKHGFKKVKKEGDVETSVTLHDLRRASCLYLGRTLDLPITLIQEHMRHADIKTTLLYMRRASDRDGDVTVKNWDDLAS